MQKLYFVSESDNLKILYPRIPNNFMTKCGAEESKTKRVCVSTSVEGCLRALSRNLKDAKLFVYSVENTFDSVIKRPSKKEVPDSGITEERWILGKTALKLEYMIQVDKSVGKGMPFSFKIKNEEYTTELYNWTFHKILSENKLANK
jgi:hypothetical protein